MNRDRGLLDALGGLLLFVTIGIGIWATRPLSAQREECATGQPLEVNLAVNSGWDLCWTVADEAGVILSDIHFSTPDGIRRKVMKEASVGQVILTPDNGSATQHLTAERGLGGERFVALDANQCPDGQIHAADERQILCQRIVSRGYIYRYFDQQRQG